MQQESLMDVLEAARYLKIGRNKLYEMAKAQMLPHLHVGASLRFDRAALDEWIRREMRMPSGEGRSDIERAAPDPNQTPGPRTQEPRPCSLFPAHTAGRRSFPEPERR